MRLLILGATGATGRLAVDQALAAGHEVVAFARDPSRLEPRPGLTTVLGNVRDADDLASALIGVDAVISTLGIGSGESHNDLIRDTTAALVAATERAGTSRVVVLSAFGVGSSLEKASALLRLLYRGVRPMFDDKLAGEEILTASNRDWVLVYPGVLTDTAATGAIETADLSTLTKVSGIPRVTRADVAAFLLTAAVTDDWSRKTVVLRGDR